MKENARSLGSFIGVGIMGEIARRRAVQEREEIRLRKEQVKDHRMERQKIVEKGLEMEEEHEKRLRDHRIAEEVRNSVLAEMTRRSQQPPQPPKSK